MASMADNGKAMAPLESLGRCAENLMARSSAARRSTMSACRPRNANSSTQNLLSSLLFGTQISLDTFTVNT